MAMGTVRVSPPLVPVTVNVYDPTGTAEVALKVTTVVPALVREVRENVPVSPAFAGL